MASVEKLNPWKRKMRRSTTGLASVSSQMTKAAKLIAATIASPMIQVEPNQSCSRPVSSMIWNAPTESTSSAMPIMSIGALARGVSKRASRVPTPKAQIATTGRLMKKIHGQPQLSLSCPPRMGPRIGAVVVVIAQIASPIPAFSFGNIRSNNICESGISGPPDSPCNTRNRTSASSVRDTPQRKEKTPKPTIEIRNHRTVPKRAASHPVSGTTIASATA